MARFKIPLKATIAAWNPETEDAAGEAVGGKTVSKRLAGYYRSERIEKKYLLLAVAPFLVTLAWDLTGRARATFWHAWFWGTVAWGLLVVGLYIVSTFRGTSRSRRGGQ